jgi:mannosyltransferase OCH1-like enzyme
LHGDWEYKLWTDEDNLRLIREYFPEYLELFMDFEYDIQRADFIRYAILYKYGGLYSDLDIVPLRAFTSDTFKGVVSDVYLMKNNSYLTSDISLGTITNALMISKVNSILWLKVMKEVEFRFRNPDWSWVSKHNNVINITGPVMLHYVVTNYDYPVAILPTNITLSSVCDPFGSTRGEKPHVMSIEGQSWNSIDTKCINFVFCNLKIILFIVFLCIVYFIYRFYKYKKHCKKTNCSV